MNEFMIACPKCRNEFKLNETLAAPIIEATREKYRQHFHAREAALQQQQQELTRAREEFDRRLEDRIAAERAKIASEEADKARLLLQTDLNSAAEENRSLKATLAARDQKLQEAQKAQAELLRKERELEDARREVELTVQRQVTAQLGAERERAKREAEESLQLKVREKEEQIASMQRKIEELQRKAEQGSQQLQGEAFELKLEDTIRMAFPGDTIEAVAKGELGADLVHTVYGPTGVLAGTIVWEIKNTRNWSDGWLAKLRNDQRMINADEALIVSQALPKGCSTFDFMEGVWVTGPQCVLPVAAALREKLLCVSAVKRTTEGQHTKMERVFDYLTGPRFRHRVEGILEQFRDMQTDLDRERKFISKQWAKRSEQIQEVLISTAGMYGDLQGIVGQSIPELDGLSEVRLIEAPVEEVE